MKVKKKVNFIQRRISWLAKKIRECEAEGDEYRANLFNGEKLSLEWALEIINKHLEEQ